MLLCLAGLAAAGLAVERLRPRGKPRYDTSLLPGVALGGYDPVSYFAGAVPQRGLAGLTLEHDGAAWRFSSAENRDQFRARPAAYLPRYGGYCAYAVAGGGTAGADPEVWQIVDGRLYLNASRRVHAKWLRDPAGYIARADANWPGVLGRG